MSENDNIEVVEAHSEDVAEDGSVVAEEIVAAVNTDTGEAVIDDVVAVTEADGSGFVEETVTAVDADGDEEVIAAEVETFDVE